MNVDDLPDDSDSSDEDYVPGSKPEDVPSEVESDGDPEDPLSDSEQVGKTTRKRKKHSATAKKKIKHEEKEKILENTGEGAQMTEEERKKKADSLWADFMKDTGFKSRSTAKNGEPSSNTSEKKTDITNTNKNTPDKKLVNTEKKEEKVKITQIFQFAGEDVKIEKEVPIDSAEARLATSKSSANASCSLPVKNSRGRGGLKGIGSVLNQLGKKAKITTLEKSKLDWDKYKKEEKIEDELEAFKKGKDGYLEKQDFLQRTDLRTFEIEKEIRNIERSKRMNVNAPM